MSNQPNKLLNIKEVADLLGVSEQTLYRMVKSRAITAYKILGSWRFKNQDIEEYLKTHSNMVLVKDQ